MIGGLVLGLGLMPLARAFSDGQAADLVLGHPTFTMDGYATARRLYFPEDIAVAPTTGAVFVADTLNHRVLLFETSLPPTSTPAAPALSPRLYLPLISAPQR